MNLLYPFSKKKMMGTKKNKSLKNRRSQGCRRNPIFQKMKTAILNQMKMNILKRSKEVQRKNRSATREKRHKTMKRKPSILSNAPNFSTSLKTKLRTCQFQEKRQLKISKHSSKLILSGVSSRTFSMPGFRGTKRKVKLRNVFILSTFVVIGKVNKAAY